MISNLYRPTISLKQNSDRFSVEKIRQDIQQTEHVPNEVLVAVDEVTLNSAALAQQGLKIESQSGSVVRASVAKGQDLAEKIAQLRATPGVVAADLNEVIREGEFAADVPNDLTEELWGLQNRGQNGGVAGADINVVPAWSQVKGSRENGPLIAIIDTGAEYTHPDLAANIWTNPGEVPGDGIDNDGNGVVDDVHGYNAADDNGDPMDRRGHGTHVAGTIAAVGNNGTGVVGVNWEARVMPVKIFDDSGRATVEGIVRGIKYAHDNGAQITNNSWGSRGYNEVIDHAFGEADDMLHVVAAGNDGRNIDFGGAYPAALGHPHILTVGATNRKDERASFSNYGSYAVDVTAPGRDIHSTWPGESYKTISGTSMATPHVTGAAALVQQKYPEASPVEIKTRLIYNSDMMTDLEDSSVSQGRINVARALEEDHAPPAAPNDLGISEMGPDFYKVSWTVPGDDGWCGQGAPKFEYKVSPTPIETLEQFEALPNRTSKRNTKQVGEIFTLEQFRPQKAEDTTLYAALRVVDDVGNSSELKTTELHIPGYDVVFEDDMEVKGNWTPDDNFGTEQVEGRGTVWSDSPGKDYENNANSILTSKFIDLTGHQTCVMEVDYMVDVTGQDFALVEWSEDGQEWHRISQVWSQDDDFRSTRFDINEASGKKAAFRFRLVSDDENTRDGLKLDRVRIIGAPSQK